MKLAQRHQKTTVFVEKAVDVMLAVDLVDAQRRESPLQGGASNGVLGRATLGW